MCVPLSVMQYCHHSAYVWGVGGVGDVCSSISHAILSSLCPSTRCGWCVFLCQSCNIAITLPKCELWVMCFPLSVMQYCHHSALVWVVGDVFSSVSHAILPSLCLSVRCGWCVFLSVMQYCHHSALVWGVGNVGSSVSHAILPSLCLSVRCGWCGFLCQSCNIAITLP